MKRLILLLALIGCAAQAQYVPRPTAGSSPTSITNGGGSVSVDSSGNINAAPAAGGSVAVANGDTYLPTRLDFSTTVSPTLTAPGHAALAYDGTNLKLSLNGGAYANFGSGTVTGGTINWPGTLYTTPTSGSVASGTLTFGPALASQSAFTIFGNQTSSSAAPAFSSSASINAGNTAFNVRGSGSSDFTQVKAGTLSLQSIATPSATPSAAVSGTTGSTTIAYVYTDCQADGSCTAKSPTVTVTTANATLTTGNKVTLTFPALGANTTYRNVYRTSTNGTSPTTTGKINASNVTATTFDDTGLAGDSATAPTNNVTGSILGTLTASSGTIAGGTANQPGDVRSYQGDTSANYVSIKQNGNKAGLFRSNTSSFAYYDTSTGDTVLDATFSGSKLSFNISATEKMRLSNSGGLNLGGTSDPGAGNLAISGTAVIKLPTNCTTGCNGGACPSGVAYNNSGTFGVCP